LCCYNIRLYPYYCKWIIRLYPCYFENQSVLPELTGFRPNTPYILQWFNPTNGKWGNKITIKSDKNGRVVLPKFPDGQNPSMIDWAAKIIKK
jgi:hypothetical protein